MLTTENVSSSKAFETVHSIYAEVSKDTSHSTISPNTGTSCAPQPLTSFEPQPSTSSYQPPHDEIRPDSPMSYASSSSSDAFHGTVSQNRNSFIKTFWPTIKEDSETPTADDYMRLVKANPKFGLGLSQTDRKKLPNKLSPVGDKTEGNKHRGIDRQKKTRKTN